MPVSYLLALAGSLAGSIIVALASIWAVRVQGEEQRKNREQRIAGEVEGFLSALKNEIQTIWDEYQQTHGVRLQELKESEEFYGLILEVGHRYLTVYEENADLLGRVRDDDLRKNIVQTYTQMKKLIDTHRVNNNLLKELRGLINQKPSVHSSSGTGQLESRIKSLKEDLIQHMTVLKQEHQKTQNHVASLLGQLR